MIKIINRIVLLAAIFCASGCTPGLWAVNDIHSGSRYTIKKSYSDEIYSTFEYDGAKLKAGAGDDISTIWLPEKGIGFVGDDNVYFVTENGPTLLSFNTLMRQVPLRMEDDSSFITFYLKQGTGGNLNGEFSQFLHFKTRKKASSLTEQQKTLLAQYQFTFKDGYYHRSVKVEGIIINKKRFGSTFPDAQGLNDRYKVRFYSQSNVVRQGVDGGKLAFNILMTPVTLTGDILLSPFYLVMLMGN